MFIGFSFVVLVRSGDSRLGLDDGLRLSAPSEQQARGHRPEHRDGVGHVEADWKPSVSAATGSTPCARGHGDRGQHRQAHRTADLQGGVVEARG
jgi:hypothetical protein